MKQIKEILSEDITVKFKDRLFNLKLAAHMLDDRDPQIALKAFALKHISYITKMSFIAHVISYYGECVPYITQESKELKKLGEIYLN